MLSHRYSYLLASRGASCSLDLHTAVLARPSHRMQSPCYHTDSDHALHRTHRRQFSASSETYSTPPKYSSPPGWSSSDGPPLPSDAESDRPPDYPEATDETDADTEGDQEEHVVYVHRHIVRSPPRQPSTHVRRRKRSAATSDPFLDVLLERSVHALEMSNTLLRSTMCTQSSISALLSSENEPDHFLEVRARNLSTRIGMNSGVHETWMDHLEEISVGVDKLFGEDGRNISVSRSDDGATSRSLPTATWPDLRHRRKPSILEFDGSSSSHLRYSHPTRDVLVAPAPRALTQYVGSAADPQLITLPSTLGILASGSSHSVHSQECLTAYFRQTDLPSVADISPEVQSRSTTPAYHLLSNLAKRSGSLSPPSSLRCSTARMLYSSPGRSQVRTQARMSRSRSETPQRPSTPQIPLPMPADEELSQSSSESSDHPTGYRTVESLRKILDNHPSSTSVNTFRRKDRRPHRVPVFLPITPSPAPIQGTSTATASISRLYTKGRHSMSTRPPSPPVHSSLKVRSVPPTPAPSPSTISLSEAFGNGIARVMGSAPSSGVSTPKRISFAELPESYSGSRPGSSRLRERKGRKGKKRKGNEKEEASGWLKNLLGGGLSIGMDREERMEERMTRGWGSRPGYGTLDDWAV